MFGKHGSNRISGKIKRIMAGFLCFVMMASYMPAAVYASEAEPAEGQIVESTENAVTDQAPVTAEEAVIEEEAAPEKSADAEETETALETVADEHEDLSNPDQTRTDYTVTTNVVGGALGNAIAVFYGNGTVQDGETTYVASDVCELNITIDPYQYWAIDGVSVTIGDEAAYIAKNDGKPYPKGTYLISYSKGSRDVIEGDVVITVETHAYPEGTHFVSFDTGHYHEHIGCVPEGSEFIPSDPWEGGVYVYDGASLSFHLNAENGYVITNVSQGYDGDDMRATNGPVHTGQSIQYGVYTTDPITEDTVICVQSEREDIHFVKFDTGSSTEIGCVPDGGDYIPTNPWQGGVYVYDGAKLYFHFNVNEGTGITKVTQGKGGKELLSSSVASYDPDKELITTGRYKTEAITADTAIVVTSAAKDLHYVNFYTGENSAQIGCVPDEGDFVAPKVWNGGVYVYDGGTFTFHFNVNNGYKITKVTQQKAGNELAADGVELTSSASDVVMGTYTYKGKYTTKVVSEETTIFVSSEVVAGDANILQWKHKEGDDNGPFKGTIVRGADSATGVIPEGVKEIEVNISTEKNSNKESDDNKIYGIRSVTATIGGEEADVEFLEPQGKKDINIPDGVYRIKKKNDDTAIGNAAVVITVETKRVHFVGFHTGSSHHVGCLPVPVLEVGGEEVRSDYIGTSPWEGGVYVFHGGEFPFRYTLTDGALVTKVRQGGGEDSPVLNPVGENVLREDEKTGRQWIETGLYTTGPITTRTYLYSDHYMQHGLVLNNGEVEYIFPDDYQNNPDAPVVKDLDGKYYLNQDADSFKFKLQPEDDSFRVATATYRVINFYDDDEEEQQYEQAYG
ncbi:MAG: hypothetical protein IJU25_04800, partial [Lachnospiraceae bacterium]|nr:hypothetical protein [Lachnospiraceae bacterium]